MTNDERRKHRGSDGWRAGMEDAIAATRSKYLAFYNDAYRAGVDAVLTILEAELANDGPLFSTCDS